MRASAVVASKFLSIAICPAPFIPSVRLYVTPWRSKGKPLVGLARLAQDGADQARRAALPDCIATVDNGRQFDAFSADNAVIILACHNLGGAQTDFAAAGIGCGQRRRNPSSNSSPLKPASPIWPGTSKPFIQTIQQPPCPDHIIGIIQEIQIRPSRGSIRSSRGPSPWRSPPRNVPLPSDPAPPLSEPR
jgi:hypothetical protein